MVMKGGKLTEWTNGYLSVSVFLSMRDGRLFGRANSLHFLLVISNSRQFAGVLCFLLVKSLLAFNFLMKEDQHGVLFGGFSKQWVLNFLCKP